MAIKVEEFKTTWEKGSRGFFKKFGDRLS